MLDCYLFTPFYDYLAECMHGLGDPMAGGTSHGHGVNKNLLDLLRLQLLRAGNVHRPGGVGIIEARPRGPWMMGAICCAAVSYDPCSY